jgi:hypothetical protein
MIDMFNIVPRDWILNVVLLAALVSDDSSARNYDYLHVALLSLLRVSLLKLLGEFHIEMVEGVCLLQCVDDSAAAAEIEMEAEINTNSPDPLYEAVLDAFLPSFPPLVVSSLASLPCRTRFRTALLHFLQDLRLCAMVWLALAPPNDFDALAAFNAKGGGYPVEEMTVDKEVHWSRSLFVFFFVRICGFACCLFSRCCCCCSCCCCFCCCCFVVVAVIVVVVVVARVVVVVVVVIVVVVDVAVCALPFSDLEIDLLFQCLDVPSFEAFLALAPSNGSIRHLADRSDEGRLFDFKRSYDTLRHEPFRLYPMPDKFDDFIQV